MKTNPELDAIFQEYEQLAAQADQLFDRVKHQFPEEVACTAGCSSCCHAAFDLSLVEAMALNRAFNREFDFGIRRSAVLQAASDADRQLTRLKRHYFQQARQGMSDEDIMVEAAKERVRCPLLGLDNTCLLYEHRPITCRIYGVPTSIHGKAHVCGECRFKKGAVVSAPPSVPASVSCTVCMCPCLWRSSPDTTMPISALGRPPRSSPCP